MSKTIWIINQYASTPATGIAGRMFYFARELVKRGHKVYLTAGGYTHILREPPKLEGKFLLEKVDGIHFLWIKLSKYDAAHSPQRVWNWFRFAWELFSLPHIIQDKPDVVLCSSPSILSAYSAFRISKRFNVKFILDIRDIWPLTLVELGGYSPRHPFIRLLQWFEDFSYRRADKIISNLPYCYKHIESRDIYNVNFTWIPNGFSLDDIELVEPLLQEVQDKIPTGKFIVGYAGTIGAANAISTLIKSAEFLKEESDIAFLIVGDGKERPVLENLIADRGVKNVHFIGSLPKFQVASIIKYFDVCYVGFQDTSLYQFGTSLNKLPEYLVSGKPIVYSINSPYLPVQDASAGISVPAEDVEAIADAILRLYRMTAEERARMGENGRIYALENFEYSKLTSKLCEVLGV